MLDNTIVIVTSDHGDMLGERGLWYKMTFFDRAIRVPLVFAGPGIVRASVSQRPVSHLDLLPTFADLAGAALAPISPVTGTACGRALPARRRPRARSAANIWAKAMSSRR